jgi:hypothetical protein
METHQDVQPNGLRSKLRDYVARIPHMARGWVWFNLFPGNSIDLGTHDDVALRCNFNSGALVVMMHVH